MTFSIPLSEAIKEAVKAEACEHHILVIEKFKSWDELLAHKKVPYWLYWYAKNVIKGKWSEAEPFIMKSPEWAYRYVCDVRRTRWPQAEPFIMQDPKWAYWYARKVIGGRWPEAEPHILKDLEWVYWYARDVLKGRWPEAEPYMKQSTHRWRLYCGFFNITG